MLRRLTVRNFKSLGDVTVNLPQLAVLFGPNAAGKSNFLEAIQALSWIGNARTLHDALNAAYPVRGYAFESLPFAAEGFPAQFARGSESFALEADLDTAGGRYRYRIAPQINYQTGELSVADEYLAQLGCPEDQRERRPLPGWIRLSVFDVRDDRRILARNVSA